MAISSGFILDAPSVTVGGNNNARAVGVLFNEASTDVMSQVIVVPLGHMLYLSAYGPDSYLSGWARVHKVVRGGTGVPFVDGQSSAGELLVPSETILHSKPARVRNENIYLGERQSEGYIAYPGSYQVELDDSSLVGDVYIEFGIVPVDKVPNIYQLFLGVF